MRHAALAAAFLAVGAIPAPSQDGPSIATGSDLIDREIEKTWKDLGIAPTRPSEDAEFLRRVHLDLVGSPPTPEEILAFLGDSRVGKREAKIDELIASPEYANYWAEVWEDVLIGYDETNRRDSKRALYGWLKDEVFAKNLPYDQMVGALITSTGISTDVGAVNFLIKISRKDGMGAISMASKASKLFMSTQIQCAQCHDHPFDRFTQDDFYGMVAFFARTKAKKVEPKDNKDNRYELYEAAAGEASFGEGKAKKNVSPKFLDEIDPPKDVPRREAFSKLLMRPENPLFAKAIVNRYWAHFFGRGIIEPVDDFSNRFKPSHPELLNRLAKDFVTHKYDLAWLVRSIANSRTYQLSSRRSDSAGVGKFFGYAATRPLTPEQLYTALVQALGMDQAEGSPASKAKDGILRQFRQRFGDEDTADRGLFQGTIPQALMIMNGAMPNGEIGRANNRLDKILKQVSAPEERLERIFLSVLNRLPTARERASFLPYVGGSAKKDPYEDVFWVLLNSSEFLFNH